MATRVVSSKQDIPEYALMTVALIEKLGFTDWEFDFDYPTPEDVNRRVQIRNDAHYAPKEDIQRMAAALKRGDDIPPIVVTADGYLVDGNTRVRAAQRIGFPRMKAIVLRDRWEKASDAVTRRLHVLGAGFNARNGRGIDRAEIANAIKRIGEDPKYDATRIAALLGVTERMVRDVLVEQRARKRAEQAGVHVNGSVPSSQLRRLGGVSDKVNTRPFTELVRLTQDAGLTVSELGDVITKVRGADSDDDALRVLELERESRREQIAEFVASKKSRPSEAAKLRQRLGFINDYEVDPARLAERSPNFGRMHADAIKRAIAVLQQVLEVQRETVNDDDDPTRRPTLMD